MANVCKRKDKIVKLMLNVKQEHQYMDIIILLRLIKLKNILSNKTVCSCHHNVLPLKVTHPNLNLIFVC